MTGIQNKYRHLLLAMLMIGATSAAQAGYYTCGSSIVSSSTRACPDGSITMYHSGDPVSFSAASLDFGNVLVGTASASKSITISNISGYSLSLPSAISYSNAFLAGSSSDCGQTLSNGGSCKINVVFTPTTTGTASGQVLVTTGASSAPYAISVQGTGIVTTGTTSTTGTTTTGSTTTNTTTTTGTSTTPLPPPPIICNSKLSAGELSIPYLVVGNTPMWAKLQSVGSVLSYKLVDYGTFATAGSSSCSAAGGTLTAGDNVSIKLGKLDYNGNYYKVTLQMIGNLQFDIVAADNYNSTTATTTTTNTTTTTVDKSVLVGNWAVHYGVGTVTFRDDGTYYAANGGSGTYSWSGNQLNIQGDLTSGKPGTAIIQVTANATWMEISWISSYGDSLSMVYYKQN